MSISRRAFLESAALAGLASRATAQSADPKTGMPMRVLGRTGAKVSIAGFGSGSRWLMYKEEEQALEALNRAIAGGVNYMDCAVNYGNGESERRMGMFLKERREGMWLVTKIQDRKYDDVMRVMDESLERLQTDHVDLLHMHALGGADDLAAIEASDGALKALYELRDQKVSRFIGVTCHTDPDVLAACLERHDLDCAQMPLNAGQVGVSAPSNVRGDEKSFQRIALPVALKKNMGVAAMKVFAQEKLLPDAKPADLIRYTLSLPIASAVMGMPKLEHIDEDLRVAKNFVPMPESEMKEFSERLSAAKKKSIDAFFANHRDICDRHGAQLG